MAYKLHLTDHAFSGIEAASDIAPYVPVTIVGSSAPLTHMAASGNLEPWGAVDAATFARGQQVAVHFSQNVVKLTAFASVGVAADVFVASVNGSVGPNPITASAHWIVGKTLSAAAAGERVSVFVNPRRA